MFPYIPVGDRLLLDSWQVMLSTGVLAGGLLSWALLRGEIGRWRALVVVAVMTIGAIFGAHLTHWLTHPGPFGRDLSRLFLFWTDGHSLFGALTFSAALLFVISRTVPGIPFWTTADAFSLGLPVGLFFARIGCYMKGCCWGTPIPEGHPLHGLSVKLIRNDLLHLHPVQLYSAGAALALFCILLALRRRQKTPGRLTALFVLLYACSRFLLEFFRGDTRPLVAHLTLHQGICVLLILAGSGLFLALARKTRDEGSGVRGQGSGPPLSAP